MDAFAGGAVIGAIVGVAAGVVGGLVAVGIALLRKPQPCPECGTPAPKVRRPANRRQMLWGGWTCPECGTELDRRGRRVRTS
jgi:ribosomal protein L37AE/L43A